MSRKTHLFIVVPLSVVLFGCPSESDSSGNEIVASAKAESCMTCHNGADHDDYSGDGLENPHPFSGGGTLKCTKCHGGDPDATTAEGAHVPPPPEIGDREFRETNRLAFFNRLTLTGIDKFEDYEHDGVTYSAIDYLQFVNPGDLRVVLDARSCGECHMPHAECVAKSPLATATGIFSGATYAAGADNELPENVGRYFDTAADKGFRFIEDLLYDDATTLVGPVRELIEFPVFSVRNDESPDAIDQNDLYLAANLNDNVLDDGRIETGSPLANLYHEQIAFTCGDCHLGSAGANNRYGDYRSSGCTSCHMRYSLDGRSYLSDPNIRKDEPLDPDDIDEPERPHVKRHMLTSVARTLNSGEVVEGIDDYTCAGCHQGSNRTVMQFWGIRLDQNADLVRRTQYPTQPDSFQTTRNDERLFDPVVGNRTFNGRNANQYILFEDYDGDGRDDTPEDVHYAAGMGCIDCHGSHDMHGGKVGDAANSPLLSRQEQAVAIRCETCHGTIDAYAGVTAARNYSGDEANVVVDAEGNAVRHVERDASGHYFLTSRLTGNRHYVPQTRDTVVSNGRRHPTTDEVIYSEKASYAMGRADGDPDTGMGPLQADAGKVSDGFSHSDNMSCISCHASWTNNCVGCHLEGEYNRGNNFSNITGERIVFREAEAQFSYQSPVLFSLGIDVHNKVSPISPNTETFFRYIDRNQELTDVFAFSDRHSNGNNTEKAAHPALAHNVMMPHSIRGRVSSSEEGPRYCVACHLTQPSLDEFRDEYDNLRTAMSTNSYDLVDFDLMAEHIGQNTGNQMNSPLWVHMVAGLGTGLFLFDQEGGPVNPLDDSNRRWGSFIYVDEEEEDEEGGRQFIPPSENFDLDRTFFNLDRMVDEEGKTQGSNNHAMLSGEPSTLRDGADNPNLAGPLGRTLIERLTDPDSGIILDSWIDANGELGGEANTILDP